MQTDVQILKKVEDVFASFRRPEHFTNFTHCEECAEYDEVLRSRDLQTLSIRDVGYAGNDPMIFCTDEGFVYYFPALVRLSFVNPAEPMVWYGEQLIRHLNDDGLNNRKQMACTLEQQRAVVEYLNHLLETRSALVDEYGCANDLFQAIEIWSDESRFG